MATCTRCGTYNIMDMGRCTNCGAQLEYQASAGSSSSRSGGSSSHDYSYTPVFGYSLGGFLLFYVVISILSGISFAIFGISATVSSFRLAKMFGSSGGSLRALGIFILITVAAVTIWQIGTAIMIIHSNDRFLGFYQKGLIICTVLLLAMIIWAVAKSDGYLSSAPLFVSAAEFFGGGIIYSIYFSSSRRVFEYMGCNTRYLKQSLFNRNSTAFAGLVRKDYDSSYGGSVLSSLSREREQESILKQGGWKCKRCGALNRGYITTCGCGNTKSDQERSEAQMKIQVALLQKKEEEKNTLDKELKAVEALSKYKELLDMGVISQEEFDEKKKILMKKEPVEEPEKKEEKKAAPVKKAADDHSDWKCKKCEAVNPGRIKCCKNCGGIKQLVGYISLPDGSAEAAAAEKAAASDASGSAAAASSGLATASGDPYANNSAYPGNSGDPYANTGAYSGASDLPQQYTDSNGTPYYLDGYGNPYYLDSAGNAYYLNQNGYPYYLDSNGAAFYYDQEGRLIYYDANGNPYYPQ